MVPDDRDKMVEDLSRKQRLIRLLYQMREKHNSKIDAMAYDDIIQKDTLYLCENQPYEFSFRAKDVIHSAYFPHFRAQMNAVPGVVTRFKFTPDISTKAMREKMDNPMFNYILMCNKICGGAHYKMKMIVVVLAENEYKDLMKAKKVTRSFKSIFHPVVAPATPGADATSNDSTAVTTVV
jgi:cytochrome c oxidase subunit 2